MICPGSGRSPKFGSRGTYSRKADRQKLSSRGLLFTVATIQLATVATKTEQRRPDMDENARSNFKLSQSRVVPASDVAHGSIDPVLEALDPDRGRPANVVTSEELTLSFGAKTILSGINMTFRRGTITALIGPTGSGKSTFLRTIDRMNDRVVGFRHEGDIKLDGRSIWSPGLDLLALRRRIAMVFQRPNPFPMSIKDNVVSGPRAHRIAEGKQLDVVAEQRLREVGLWDAVKDRLGETPFKLSGGQQQLMCLARALAVGPEVILLDEPTSALDPTYIESIEALMRQMTPAITLILVTHNLGQARRVSDTTMFFYDGRLVEHGDTEQIFEHPRETDTERYVNGRMG